MAESIGALRVEISASTAAFESSMAKAGSVLAKWNEGQQRSAMAMARAHDEARKVNAALDAQARSLDNAHAEALKLNSAYDAQHSSLNQFREAMGRFGTENAESFRAVGQALGLVVAGVGAAGAAIVALGIRGSEVEGVRHSFEELARSVGQTGSEILNVTRTATKGLITDMSLMESTNKAILLGLPVTAREMGTLGATAISLGRAMKLGPEQAMNDLITALGRGSPLILDNLGLTVKVGEANEKYAAQLKKPVAELTEAEKKLAFYNAAMEAAKKKVEELGEVQLTFGERVQQARVMLQNFTDNLGVAIATSPVVIKAMDYIGEAMQNAFGKDQQGTIRVLIEHVNDFARMLVEVGKVAVVVAQAVSAYWHGLQMAFNTAAQVITDKVRQLVAVMQLAAKSAAALRFPGAADAARELDNIRAHLDGLSSSFGKQAIAASKSAQETHAGLGKVGAGLARLGVELDAASKKQVNLTDAQIHALRTGAELTKGTGELTEAQKKAGEAAEKAALKMREFWRDFGHENYVRAKKTSDEFWENQINWANRWSRDVIKAFLDNKEAADKLEKKILDAADAARKLREEAMDKRGWAAAAAESTFEMGELAETLGELGPLFDELGVQAGSTLRTLAEDLWTAAEGAEALAVGLESGDPAKMASGVTSLTAAVKGLVESESALNRFIGGMLVLGPIGGTLAAIFGGPAYTAAERLNHELMIMRGEFINAAGGLHVLEEKAARAGVSLDAVWNARTVAEYEAAVNRVNRAIALNEEATEKTKAAMDRWNLTIADLGPTFAGQMLSEQLLEIYQDFRLLETAGGDVAKILGDPNDPKSMAHALGNIVRQAIATGAKLPLAMRPFIETLIEQKVLLDENGEVITDISQLQFTESLEEGVGRLIDKIEDLVNALLGIPPEVETLVKVRTEHVGDGPPPQGEPPLPPDGEELPGFASGGVGDFGAGTLAVLHGREAIVPLDGGGPFATGFAAQVAGEVAAAIGGGRGQVIENHLYLDGQELRDWIIRNGRVGALTRD